MNTQLSKEIIRDYSLIGAESKHAVEMGLAEASWYTSPVPRDKMRELLIRRNGPAITDTVLWFGLIFSSGWLFYISWGHWWAVFPYIIYSVLYASTSDSRWHESSHGTAFKSDWMNNVLYEIASFMVFRQSIPWRWSHTRHHSDTIIRGRDPEIAVPRPADLVGIVLNFFALRSTPKEFRKIIKNAIGRIDPEVATYLPASEYGRVFFRARVYLGIFAGVILLSIVYQSVLPLMFVGFPTFFGSWLKGIYGLTQHAGLDENVLDHRLNCRTVYMNRINRWLYWNMNYHVEHHMFPLVPYHALPKLHELVKNDCPVPYKSIPDAFREIIPALIKQSKDPHYFVKRELPPGAGSLESTKNTGHVIIGNSSNQKDGWIAVCAAEELREGDVLRFDVNNNTYAIYHTQNNQFYATDGICTHGNTHLSDGLVIGDVIECPKHNGRFSIVDGSVKRPPVCAALKTYEIKVKDSMLWLNTQKPGGAGAEEEERSGILLKVVNNKNVSAYIRELTLEPLQKSGFEYNPGDYIQLEIPSYELSFKYFNVHEPYNKLWHEQHIFCNFAKNSIKTRRNYSMATNPSSDKHLMFNVRLALPPDGKNYSAGVGSAYVFSLKPGDTVKAFGPFGDFHIKDNQREMVYIGGGAGMAPLRSHISYLFETLQTNRKVSFWYGARTAADIFYADYFEKLAAMHSNFSFHVALSEPKPEDNSKLNTGFIHEVVKQNYLDHCSNAAGMEYYLCGPPAMIKATTNMLINEMNVNPDNISYDEF
jgi:Na+-transporting NADH:ubiquinone oxidoreductase subunit F